MGCAAPARRWRAGRIGAFFREVARRPLRRFRAPGEDETGMTTEEAREFFTSRVGAAGPGNEEPDDTEAMARLRAAYERESRRAASPAEAVEVAAAWRHAQAALPPGERLAKLVERSVGDRLSPNSWREVLQLTATAVILTALLVAIFFASQRWHFGRDSTAVLFAVVVALVYFVGRRL